MAGVRPVLVTALVAALAATAPAGALGAVTAYRDAEGRPIRVDVRAQGVSGGTYADILRDSVHGDEISTLTMRVVPVARIASICGSQDALACYSGGLMVVPAAPRAEVERTVLHEYGHHIDAERGGATGDEPDGTRRWWTARGMAARVAAGEVARDYSRGWERSIGEIFAEDYVQVNMAADHAIDWLPPPSAAVLRAIRRDVTGSAEGGAGGGAPGGPGTESRAWVEAGVLTGGATARLPFGTLGPGRRLDLTVTLSAPATVRATLWCGGRVVARARVDGGATLTLTRGGLPTGSCAVALTNLGAPPVEISAELTLTRPAA